eukprot:Awhi_evm1s11841
MDTSKRSVIRHKTTQGALFEAHGSIGATFVYKNVERIRTCASIQAYNSDMSSLYHQCTIVPVYVASKAEVNKLKASWSTHGVCTRKILYNDSGSTLTKKRWDSPWGAAALRAGVDVMAKHITFQTTESRYSDGYETKNNW